MRYKSFVSLNIAVIGAGPIAEFIAEKIADAGHVIYMGIGEDDVVDQRLLEEFDSIHLTDVESAAQASDMIIIATAPAQVREVAYWLGDVRRKVIFDYTSVVDSEKSSSDSLGAIKAITGAIHTIKVFRTKGFENILKPLFNGKRIDAFVAGDSVKAKEMFRIMIKDVDKSNDCYDFGGDDSVELIEDMYKSWYKQAKKADAVKFITFKLLK